MPTYVYACSACDRSFEVEQRITEDALLSCVLCNADGTVKRVIQPVGVMFKGEGFHINDYAPTSAKPVEAESPAATPMPQPAESSSTTSA